MRITKVSVKKLFGIFDHEIPLKDSRITIIHGPNGIGKTVLLTMIHGLFNSKYEVFYDVPFQEFRVEFDGEESIAVKKETASSQVMPAQDHSNLSIMYCDSGLPYRLRSSEEHERIFHEEIDSIPELRQIGSNLFFNRKTDSTLTKEEVIEIYDHLRSKLYNEPDWLTYIKAEAKVHTRFIQTQRLQSRQIVPANKPFFIPYSIRREIPSIPNSAVEEYSDEIVKTIRTTFEEYGELSQARERSFPGRVIGGSGVRDFDRDLYDKLKVLESKRVELMELGLLEKDKDVPDIPKLDEALEGSDKAQEELAKVFFSTYIQDVEEKLSVFDEISEQLRILTEIINERFKFKTLMVNKSDGFIFVAQDGEKIPITNLSSGEQHELILFYQLLFHVQPNSLILIDEPELSLHVVWQRNFLKDLQRIVKLRKFDVLVATHSPQIVHDKWDWMVDLDEPESVS